jgi:hypothetical protein
MMRDDYPRGAARREIVDARAQAQADLEASQAYYTDLSQRAETAGEPIE